MKEFKISVDFARMSEEERVNALNAQAIELNEKYTYFRDLTDLEVL